MNVLMNRNDSFGYMYDDMIVVSDDNNTNNMMNASSHAIHKTLINISILIFNFFSSCRNIMNVKLVMSSFLN